MASPHVRVLDEGDRIVNLQKNAMDELLDQNFDIFSSKFQYEQFVRLIHGESVLERKQNFQYAGDLCEYICPSSTKVHTFVKQESDQLVQKTMMSDKEDAIHPWIARLLGAIFHNL